MALIAVHRNTEMILEVTVQRSMQLSPPPCLPFLESRSRVTLTPLVLKKSQLLIKPKGPCHKMNMSVEVRSHYRGRWLSAGQAEHTSFIIAITTTTTTTTTKYYYYYY